MRASYKFKSVWRFKQVESDFIESKAIGRTYNFFSGESHIGAIKIDIAMKADYQFDIRKQDKLLEFFKMVGPSETTILDPPFKIWFEVSRLRQFAWLNKIADWTKRRLILVGGWKLLQFADFQCDLPPYLYIGPSGELKVIYIYNRISSALPLSESSTE